MAGVRRMTAALALVLAATGAGVAHAQVFDAKADSAQPRLGLRLVRNAFGIMELAPRTVRTPRTDPCDATPSIVGAAVWLGQHRLDLAPTAASTPSSSETRRDIDDALKRLTQRILNRPAPTPILPGKGAL